MPQFIFSHTGYVALALVVGIAIGYMVWKWRRKGAFEERNQERREEIERRKTRILAYMSTRQEVAHRDIQELLSVSDATVIRYLDELEHEGKITQQGTTGRGTVYVVK